MQYTHDHVSTTQIRYEIPTLHWLRLRWLRRHKGTDMLPAVVAALGAGLDALGVPGEAKDLLDPRPISSSSPN